MTGIENRLILLRHGQSEANVDHTIYQHKDDHLIELTNLGKSQAESAGEYIKEIIGDTSRLDVFVSPYTRTMQTWEAVKKGLHRNNINLEIEPRIREQEFQVFANSMERASVFEEQARRGRFWFRFSDAESGVDVFSRICTFLTELRLDRKVFNTSNDCLVVAHEITLRCILMKVLKLNIHDFDSLPDIENCTPIVLKTFDFKNFTFDEKATMGNRNLKEYLANAKKV